MRAPFAATLLFLLAPSFACAQQADPAALPARDTHEGLLVAADPYRDAARVRERFGKKNPHDAGILPVELFFRNDTDRAIRVNLERIQLLLAPPGEQRQRLEPLAVEDVVDRMLNKGGPNPTMPRRPLPGRRPGGGHGKEARELEETLRPLLMEMNVLPPHSTVHGFLFFDVSHHYDLVRYARLYVPELKFLPDEQALMFFEVELAPAVRH